MLSKGRFIAAVYFESPLNSGSFDGDISIDNEHGVAGVDEVHDLRSLASGV